LAGLSTSIIREMTVMSRVIAFQPPNQIGLGHINRLAAIALAIQDVAPHIRTPFIIEGNSHGLLESFGLPELCLPTDQDFSSRGRWNAWPREQRNLLRQKLAQDILELLEVDLLVFDCFPSMALVRAAIGLHIKMVLVLRRVKSLSGYLSDKRVQFLLPHIDRVIIPHEETDFPEARALAPSVSYVGNVVRPLPVDPDPISARFHDVASKWIVITSGGGGYSESADFLNNAIQAFNQVRSDLPEFKALVIPGPMFAGWEKLKLSEHVRVLPFAPDLDSIFATADLVICQGGYNTLLELAALGTPTVCVPAQRGFDDQFRRASETADAYTNIRISSNSHPDDIALLVGEILGKGNLRRRDLRNSGSAAAANQLYDLAMSLDIKHTRKAPGC